MKLAFKLVYRCYRFFSWGREWLDRRCTRAGLALMAGMALTAVMGIDTENNVDYQAFAVLFGLFLVAMATGWRFKGRFAVTRRLPHFGTVGWPLQFTAVVRNLGPKSQKGLVLLEELADPRPPFEEWLTAQLDEERSARSFRLGQSRRINPFRVATLKESPVPPIPPGEEVEVQVELTPLRRGILRFTGVALARSEPLGLLRALSRVSLPQTILVLPKRYPLPPISLAGMLKYQEGGVALASHVGQSEDFIALRDYRHGDPLRHIHWRSWARIGRPVVREFEDEFFVRHALILDTFTDTLRQDVFEEAVAVAASFACTVQTQESLLDLLFVGPHSYCFTSGRGLAQADQMLEVLASVRLCRDQPFSALEHLVMNHARVVSGCICVFVAWDRPRQDFVEKLRGIGLPVLVLVVVAPGQSKGLEPGPMRAEPDKFHVLEVGRIAEGLVNLG